MTLDEQFALTPQEKQRLTESPFQPGEGGWQFLASVVHQQVLASYAEGEADLRQILSIVRACSLGCTVPERIGILALTVENALTITPKKLQRKRPRYPRWLRHSAATLLEMLQQDHPEETLAPNEMNQWTTPLLETTITWLITAGLIDTANPIKPRTLYDWYREYKKTVDTPPNSA